MSTPDQVAVIGEGGGPPCGVRNGNYRHGLYTKAAIAERRHLSMLLKMARELVEAI